MPRIARVVVPGLPHHITQRGNRRQTTFFTADDYRVYLSLLRWWAPRTGVKIWAYCLMPNHAHVVAVPEDVDALADCMSNVHRRYSRQINAERGWTGYLWQGRFHSTVMDGVHAIAAARYVAMNPVRAGLVTRPADWLYSSARTHLGLADDKIVEPTAYTGLIDDWAALLALDASDDALDRVRSHTRTGRPLGGDAFVSSIEATTGRTHLARSKGRPRLPQVMPEKMVSVPI